MNHMQDDMRSIAPTGKDIFCWLCHRRQITVSCSSCIRSYHGKCLKLEAANANGTEWQCPECVMIKESERNNQNKEFDIQPLKYLMNRIFKDEEYTEFEPSVSKADHPDFYDLIVNPLSLNEMKRNIAEGKYKSTRGFLADIKWIHHNCCAFFKDRRDLHKTTRYLVKYCTDEIESIETCKECFINANTRADWFTVVCSTPHLILWTKLAGFPYWPSKLMSINGNQLLVRFFGDHKNARINIKNAFLYSRASPRISKKSDSFSIRSLPGSLAEADLYIMSLRSKYGNYVYADARIPFDPEKFNEYIQALVTDQEAGSVNQPKSKIPQRRNTIAFEHNDESPTKLDARRKSVQFDLTQNQVFEIDCENVGNNKRKRLLKERIANKAIPNKIVRKSIVLEEPTISPSPSPPPPPNMSRVILIREHEQRENERNGLSSGINIDSMVTSVIKDMIGDNFKDLASIISIDFEDKLSDFIKKTASRVQLRMLEMEIETMKKNHERDLAAMKTKYERIIAENKEKQWCINCNRGTQSIYCCGSGCHKEYLERVVANRLQNKSH